MNGDGDVGSPFHAGAVSSCARRVCVGGFVWFDEAGGLSAEEAEERFLDPEVEGDRDANGSSDLREDGEGDTRPAESRQAGCRGDLRQEADEGEMDQVERVGGVAEPLDPRVSTDREVPFLGSEKSEKQAGAAQAGNEGAQGDVGPEGSEPIAVKGEEEARGGEADPAGSGHSESGPVDCGRSDPEEEGDGVFVGDGEDETGEGDSGHACDEGPEEPRNQQRRDGSAKEEQGKKGVEEDLVFERRGDADHVERGSVRGGCLEPPRKKDETARQDERIGGYGTAQGRDRQGGKEDSEEDEDVGRVDPDDPLEGVGKEVLGAEEFSLMDREEDEPAEDVEVFHGELAPGVGRVEPGQVEVLGVRDAAHHVKGHDEHGSGCATRLEGLVHRIGGTPPSVSGAGRRSPAGAQESIIGIPVAVPVFRLWVRRGLVREMSDSFHGGGLEQGRSFRTTHWSVVMAARHAPTAESVAALEVLAKTYWMPLYAFIRRRGADPSEAQDLTQGFFARLLEKEWLLAADAERGRFRTFLLTALTRFLSDEYDRATALKRGGGATLVSLDFGLAEERLSLEPADGRTPEQAFDRAWAEALLEKVLSRLSAEFDDGGRTGRFAILKQFLTEDAEDGSYARAAAELGLSESAVKSGIHRLRRRYGELIHEEIALTLVAEADIDSELEHFLSALGG